LRVLDEVVANTIYESLSWGQSIGCGRNFPIARLVGIPDQSEMLEDSSLKCGLHDDEKYRRQGQSLVHASSAARMKGRGDAWQACCRRFSLENEETDEDKLEGESKLLSTKDENLRGFTQTLLFSSDSRQLHELIFAAPTFAVQPSPACQNGRPD
jgi:hypothetical protein